MSLISGFPGLDGTIAGAKRWVVFEMNSPLDHLSLRPAGSLALGIGRPARGPLADGLTT